MKREYIYRWIGLGIVFCAAGLMACAPPPSTAPAAPTQGETATPLPEVTAEATRQGSPPAEGPILSRLDEAGRDLVSQARQDLAGRLKVRPDEIRLAGAEPIMWPDASLGCPQPGMVYAQVVTPGYRIWLEYGDRSYDYHAGRGRVILCEE